MEISSLPETLIHEILSRLPTKSAASTSLLSRQWRHRWRSIPNLDLSHLPHSQILTIIDLHSGPIRFFKARSDDSAVLSALSRRFSSFLLSLDLSDFAAPLHLSSIAAEFPNLRHLRLSFCSLRSDLANFPFLQTLHLENVRFSSLSGPLHLSALIPSCRSLESLTLILFEGDLCCDLFACEFPNLVHLKLSYCDLEFVPPDSGVKLPALRTLHLDSGDFYGRISGVFEACPGLERMSLMYVGSDRLQWVDVVGFHLRGIEFVEVMSLKGFVVTSAPLLERIVMNCRVCCGGGDGGDGGGGDSGECNLMKLLGGVNYVKKLKLGNGIFEVWFVLFWLNYLSPPK